MIEKRNSIIMLIFATILTVVALIYGFSAIPSPMQQRVLKLDHKRVSDLGQLQYSVEDYYQNNGILPQTLDVLEENSYSPSETLDKTDPETKKPYEYTLVTPNSYKLCATFTTDSSQQSSSYDDENYTYDTYKSKFKHPKGYYCFTLHVRANLYNPSPIPLDQSEGATILPIPVGTNAASKTYPATQ